METVFLTEILKSLGDGNFSKGVFMILVFVVIWLEVRSLKKQLKSLNEVIAKSFAKGEVRFVKIEGDVSKIRVDLDLILKPTGGEA